MKIVPLTPEDDIVSICDHLDWAHDQQLILVLPENGGVLREGLDLVRLLRHADNRRAQVALVTADVDITRQARAIGFAVFTTIGAARKQGQRWWHGRKRREWVGLSTVGDSRFADYPGRPRLSDADQAEAHKRLDPPLPWQRWLWRYAAIFLFFLTVGLLYVSFLYLLPTATITLLPQLWPLEVERPIIADPLAEMVDFQSGILPGRLLQTSQNWQATVQTTGSIEVADGSAHGNVLFVNLLPQAVTIPAGTRVSTSDGRQLLYQTVAEANLPDVVGSTVEVAVTAVLPGPESNIGPNLINQVEGSLSVQLQVRNLDPIEGGLLRSATAVTEADRQRLRQQVVQFLLAMAAAEMEGQLVADEFLTHDTLRVVSVVDETYSHEAGEQTSQLTLSMRAQIAGTAVNTTAASDLALYALGQQISPGFSLVPDSIRFESGPITGVDEAGRVTFSMIAAGSLARELPTAEVVDAITGQELPTAVAHLNAQLALREPAHISVWPTWFDRMPYLTTRIKTVVEP